jgi:hypothetical protein
VDINKAWKTNRENIKIFSQKQARLSPIEEA